MQWVKKGNREETLRAMDIDSEAEAEAERKRKRSDGVGGYKGNLEPGGGV